MERRLCFLWIGALAVVLGSPDAGAAELVGRQHGQEWLHLHLRWTGSEAIFTFNQDDPTSDWTAFPTPPDYHREFQKWTDWTNGQNVKVGDPIIIRSDPMPRTYRIDPSRPLLVNMTSKVCLVYDYEIRIDDDVFLTGRAHPNPHVPSNPKHVPGVSGGGICSANSDSSWNRAKLPAEAVQLPQGSRLVMRLWEYDLACPEQSAGPCATMEFQFTQFRAKMLQAFYQDRSAIRIPVFTPEDSVLRTTPLAGVDASGAMAAGLLLAGRLRTRGPLLVALLMTSVLAGCLQDRREETTAADATAGTATIRTLDPNELGAEGTILGIVRDELHQPLSSVLISVVGASASARTDADGFYRIDDLPDGEYTVRFLKPGFLPFEKRAQLPPRSSIRIDVALVPQDGLGPDFRPHDHAALWQGEVRRVVFDGAFTPVNPDTGDTRCAGMRGTTQIVRCELVQFGLPPTAPGGAFPNTILPGTDHVLVNVTWPESVDVRRVGLRVQAVGLPMLEFYPRASGVPFTVRTTWETTDDGHASQSRWRFALFVPTNTPLTEQDFGGGVFKVQITIFKGVVPLERAHPDLWLGQHERIVLPYQRLTVGTPAAFKAVVPPGTAEVELFLERSFRPRAQYDLNYVTAAPGQTVRALAPVDDKDTYQRYRIRVCPLDADTVYQTSSLWWIRLSRPDDPANRVAAQLDALEEHGADQGVSQGALAFAAQVVARRGPVPEGCPP